MNRLSLKIKKVYIDTRLISLITQEIVVPLYSRTSLPTYFYILCLLRAIDLTFIFFSLVRRVSSGYRHPYLSIFLHICIYLEEPQIMQKFPITLFEADIMRRPQKTMSCPVHVFADSKIYSHTTKLNNVSLGEIALIFLVNFVVNYFSVHDSPK